MYRINDKSEAIKRVQRYLSVVLTPAIFIAPTGVYDEETRTAVMDYQNTMSISSTGIVDYQTFELLYRDFERKSAKNRLNERLENFISFPLIPGSMSEEMTHINRILSDLLNYYGHTHRLIYNNFYSDETSLAVNILQDIYNLNKVDYIDEEMYIRMVDDHNSISRINNIY